ncbi:MAG: alpha-amylase family glycosyl hydrolase [Acidimicrobiales bacterium]
MSGREQTPWWRQGVVYQIYIRSFADSDGDGTGDIGGIRSRLDHLVALGVDAIWVNPWYESPLADGGYDVTDYRAIDERFGTLDDVDHLIAEAHDRGIRVVGDIVPNHTSDQHRWFREAVAAEPGDPVRDRYLIRPGRGPHGDQPPNNWLSVFGGPAWTRLHRPDGTPEDWYLHLFTPEQPDLDWDNPEVRAEFLAILRFWFDRGIDGIRIDVAHGLAKHSGLPDLAETEVQQILGHTKLDDHPHWDRDEVLDIFREWRQLTDAYGDRFFVAEAWAPSPERLARYVAGDVLHQAFAFDVVEAPWRAPDLRQAIGSTIDALGRAGTLPTWTLSNHDVVRHTTRYGLPPDTDWRRWLLGGDRSLLDAEAGVRRARAAALLMLALPGSVYLYQGEELGLPEVIDLPLEILDDPVYERSGRTMKGRDGCRVPIPWKSTGSSLGFGSGAPWLPQPAEWAALSVEAQTGDLDSVLELYRSTLALRRELMADDESFEWRSEPDATVLDFERRRVRCLVNMGPASCALPPGGAVVAASGPLVDGELPPDTAVWIT